MNKRTLLVATTMAFAIPGASVFAQDLSVGVSWSNFQEERWKTDEAAIQAALEEGGAEYVSADAQSSSAKQLSDVESLIAQGVDALIILAQDTQAIIPAVQAASDAGFATRLTDLLMEHHPGGVFSSKLPPGARRKARPFPAVGAP